MVSPIGTAKYPVGTAKYPASFSAASLFSTTSRGDYWTVDATTGTVGQSVQNLVGKRGNFTFTQATAGSRPILNQRADGAYYLDFASAKTMSVASSAALFNYLHDGTGCTVMALMEWSPTAVADNFLNNCSGTSQTGVVLSKAASSQVGVVTICRSSAGNPTVTGNELSIPASSGRLSMWGYSYKNNAAASDLRVSFDIARNSTFVQTTNTPDAGNASASLTISAAWGSRLYALLIIDRVITQLEWSSVYNNWLNTYKYILPSIDAIGILIGQSNDSGRGTITPAITAPIDGAYTWPKMETYYERAVEPLHFILNQNTPTSPTEPQTPAIGPGTAMAQGIKQGNGKNILLVPCSVGTTTIAQWDVPTDLGNRGTLFGACVYRANVAKAAYGSRFFILIVGHESSASLAVPDYTNGGVGTGYQSAMTQYAADLRAALGENAPLIMAQLGESTDLPTSVTYAGAGEAQRQLELTIPNCVMIPAYDLQLQAADGIHYVAAGQATLGARAAIAARKLVFGENLNVGPRLTTVSRSGAVVSVQFNSAIVQSVGNYGNMFDVYDNGVKVTINSAARNGTDQVKIDITCSATLVGPVTVDYGYRAGSSSAPRTDVIADLSGNLAPVFGPLLVT